MSRLARLVVLLLLAVTDAAVPEVKHPYLQTMTDSTVVVADGPMTALESPSTGVLTAALSAAGQPASNASPQTPANQISDDRMLTKKPAPFAFRV